MYIVEVPGSLMLFGEHAVLRGGAAVVAAIDRYLRVTLTPRTDSKINICSQEFGKHSTVIGNIKVIKPYDYVLSSILKFSKYLKVGFNLEIDSAFSSNLGLGSSAAVTVAVLGVLNRWLHGKLADPLKLHRKTVNVIRSIQGFGSGADAAASIFGGIMLTYGSDPVEKIGNYLPLTIIYSGYKTPTSEVVAKLRYDYIKYHEIFDNVYAGIDSCSKAATVAIVNSDLVTLGNLMNIHQGFQEALGVSNNDLASIILLLRNDAGIRGAKISGSGLGDCVIGLGELQGKDFKKNSKGVRKLKVAINDRGIRYI